MGPRPLRGASYEPKASSHSGQKTRVRAETYWMRGAINQYFVLNAQDIFACARIVRRPRARRWRGLLYLRWDGGRLGPYRVQPLALDKRTHKKEAAPPFGGREFDGAIAQRTNIETR
jgi:hypothetical protein